MEKSMATPKTTADLEREVSELQTKLSRLELNHTALKLSHTALKASLKVLIHPLVLILVIGALAVLWGAINGLLVDVRTRLFMFPSALFIALIGISAFLLILLIIRHWGEVRSSWLDIIIATLIFMATALAITMPGRRETESGTGQSVLFRIKASDMTSGTLLARRGESITLWIIQKIKDKDTLEPKPFPNLVVRDMVDSDGRIIGLSGIAPDSLVLDIPKDQFDPLIKALANKQGAYITRDRAAGTVTSSPTVVSTAADK
jgi:hypothetical protein